MYAYGLWHFSTNRFGDVPFFMFFKLYSTLEGAKNSSLIKEYSSISSGLYNSTWFIVPQHRPYERSNYIKYQLIDGKWTRDIDDKLQDFFTNFREG